MQYSTPLAGVTRIEAETRRSLLAAIRELAGKNPRLGPNMREVGGSRQYLLGEEAHRLHLEVDAQHADSGGGAHHHRLWEEARRTMDEGPVGGL